MQSKHLLKVIRENRSNVKAASSPNIPRRELKKLLSKLPVVQGYNNLNQEQRYQFRKLLRSFVKWYNFISQIIRMFSKDLHKEYLFCKYLEKLVPADVAIFPSIPKDLTPVIVK